MNASVGVYLRNNQFIVVPQGGGGGLYYELDDVRVVGSVAELQTAIEGALQSSSEAFGRPVPDLTKRKWPLLKHLRLKSARQLYADIAYCAVFVSDARIEVFPYVPRCDGRGFELSATIPPTATLLPDLAAAVARVLSALPKMNPPASALRTH